MTSIDEFEERMIHRLRNSSHFKFSDFEEKLLMIEEDKIERYIRRKNREIVQAFIKPYYAGIVHAESYHSELGNALGKEHEYLDYIAILNLGTKKISFRTIHDHIDVSEIAGLWGGGGHAKASGCSINEETFQVFVKPAFENEPIRQDACRNQFNIKNTPHGCLYENSHEDLFFIFEKEQGVWAVEVNGIPWKNSFADFAEAEKHIKRHYSAWLSKDEQYVEFLRNNYLQIKKKG